VSAREGNAENNYCEYSECYSCPKCDIEWEALIACSDGRREFLDTFDGRCPECRGDGVLTN